MADEKDREEIIVAEFHKKIKEAFEVFDHESNNTVDVREIGTIIRSLGCCPTEGELHDLIAEVEEEEPTGYIRFEKFLPVMTEILLERRYRPIPEDVLLRAFEVLDSAKRGFLTKDELIKYMTEEGSISSAHSPLWRVGSKGGDTLPPRPCHTVISPNASHLHLPGSGKTMCLFYFGKSQFSEDQQKCM
ncbi:dynein regulatory complex protein 8 isoform X3 [Macaca mulatta]|uniref:EF-hand calcium binding domain 2 n=1 Tax=Macaca fascicularis TaxID=9541 RepID=A0A2K5X531_MACFA